MQGTLTAMNAIQEYLFQRIKEKLPASASLADAVADCLFVSSDSAYRRIRGETPLVLEEAKTLCDKFSISLDEAVKAKKNSVSFTYTQLDHHHYSFEKYLSDILANLKMTESFQQRDIVYMTKDIPVFYNFFFRPLFSFRYFFWMKSIIQHPEFVHKKYSPDLLPKEIEDIGKEIIQVYKNLPSTEIWNTECINSTISQIEYYREAGYFQAEKDIDNIYKSLIQLIEHLRVQAEVGAKFLPGESVAMKQDNYHFYYNRVVLGDNTVLLTLNGKQILYLTYDVLNYMITQDEHFCADTNNKLQMLMRRATLLSNTSDKQRNIFFNILLRKIPQSSYIKDFS